MDASRMIPGNFHPERFSMGMRSSEIGDSLTSSKCNPVTTPRSLSPFKACTTATPDYHSCTHAFLPALHPHLNLVGRRRTSQDRFLTDQRSAEAENRMAN